MKDQFRVQKLLVVMTALGLSGLGVVFDQRHVASAVPSGSCTTGTYAETAVGADTVGTFTAPAGASTSGCTWNVPAGVTSVRVLVVAGGGGGGGQLTSGGGGAGGVVHESSFSVTSNGTVSVTVGKGGAAGSDAWNRPANYNNGDNGDNSVFGSVTAIGGGGGGGGGTNSQIGNPGSAGGSGGGGGRCWVGCNTSFSSSNGNKRVGGAGTNGQGNRGGHAPYMSGAGGGGAGGPGEESLGTRSGVGGDGVAYDISGTSTHYGGGGGGGSENTATRAAGGLGGGGSGGANNGAETGVAGTAGTGGGGGGAKWSGAAGGSGIVIIRWGTAPTAPVFSLSASSGYGVLNSSLTSPYSVVVTSGSVTSYSISPSLPAGLSFDSSTGLVSGTPTSLSALTSYTITARRVNATNGGSASSTQTFDFGVYNTAPTTTTTTTTSTTTTSSTTTTVPGSSTTAAPATTVATTVAAVEVAPTTTVSFGQTQIARVVTSTTIAERQAQATAASTTSTVPRPVATTVAPSTTVPEIAEAAPGEASLLVGGEEVEATLSRSNDQLVIAAGEMSATISGVTSDGAIAPLDSEGNIRLSDGDQIQVEASGFAPNSDVEVWLFSTPTLLGTVAVNGEGTASSKFALPRGVESGNHRVALNGKNAVGDDASFAVGIVIGSSSGGVSTAGKVLISVPIALAVLFALVIPARRRRKVELA